MPAASACPDTHDCCAAAWHARLLCGCTALQEDTASLDPHLTAVRAAHREAYGVGGSRNGPSYVDKTFGIQLERDDNALMERLLRPTRDAKDMPPATEFELSARLIKAHADTNNVVMVTWANFHYLDFGAY